MSVYMCITTCTYYFQDINLYYLTLPLTTRQRELEGGSVEATTNAYTVIPNKQGESNNNKKKQNNVIKIIQHYNVNCVSET